MCELCASMAEAGQKVLEFLRAIASAGDAVRDPRSGKSPARPMMGNASIRDGYILGEIVVTVNVGEGSMSTNANETRLADIGGYGFNQEVSSGERFEFGKNWQRFLSVLNEDRILEAERSLREMLGMDSLTGMSFLDIGSGSGLFSLAAMRLGATRVHSFDYDPHSVACTKELKRRYFPDAQKWTVAGGDVLNPRLLEELGVWDIVYSWGVLHHTGNMWQAIENATALVKPGGLLFISIYNDQGAASKRWRLIKRLYNQGTLARYLLSTLFIPYFVVRNAAANILRGKNPIRAYQNYKKSRGMSRIYDWLDWLGGYPYEVARPDEILRFCQERNFSVERLKLQGRGWGCNEFVMRKA